MEIIIFLIAFPVCFAAAFFSVLLLVLWLAGFNKLSKYFLIGNKYVKSTQKTHIQIGFMHFMQNAELGIYHQGIFLKLCFPFNLLVNKSFFIPWTEINIFEDENQNTNELESIDMEWGPDKIQVTLFDSKTIQDLYSVLDSELSSV